MSHPYHVRDAPTLEDRSIIYQPNTVKGNKPINIGHSYSVLTALPPRESTGEIPWAIPLMVNRVKSSETGKQVGSQQLKQILTQKNLPWSNQRSVLVVDSDYSAKTFLSEQSQHPNLVVVTRVRSNRVFYQSPEISSQPSKGHPLWYGEKFALKDEATWHEPNEVAQTNLTTKRGRLLKVTIQSWSDMLMRGSHDCPMHDHPFTLMQIQVTSPEGMRIITEIGTPANLPKPRGYSAGRATGMIQTKRTRHQVLKKAQQLEPTPPIAV